MSDLLHVGQISVLSEEDRRTLHEARRWVRFIVLQAASSKLPTMEDPEERFAFRFDGNERRGLAELLERLDSIAARTSSEPQLRGSVSGPRTGQAVVYLLAILSCLGLAGAYAYAVYEGWLP